MSIDAVPLPPSNKLLHAHHWVIESPAGSLSVGRCTGCGSERSFSNASPASSWVRDPTVEPDVIRLRRDLARWRAEPQLADEAA